MSELKDDGEAALLPLASTELELILATHKALAATMSRRKRIRFLKAMSRAVNDAVERRGIIPLRPDPARPPAVRLGAQSWWRRVMPGLIGK
jgi:hypothetical protein